MYKKRGDAIRFGNKGQIARGYPLNKSGQITIFIIIGLLILFAFFFTLQLTSQIQEGQLEEAREQVLSKNFQKEALRIFVQDCLTDELEQGLILIGKQGRLWADQPGGTKVFEEGVTGVNYNPGDPAGRIFYAITREDYPTEENAFPCDNESNSPEFCQYKYPNTQVGFGNLELSTSTLQNDLRRFLINRTTWCVENFTRNNISSEAVVETETISLNMDIVDGGINAEVDYPLRLILGNEEFFHLSEFDFFYPTQFKALLDSAVALPLRMDWKYVDFNYTKETMESAFFTHGFTPEEPGKIPRDCSLFEDDYFLCKLALPYDKYSSIGIEMKNKTLPNGDELFIFQAAPYSVLNSPEQFEYRFLRQNRAPALDYVSRLECPQAVYDYLVIKGDDKWGEIDINLNAKDADEDKFRYGFTAKDEAILKALEIAKDNYFNFKPDPNFPEGVYEITTYAIDEYGQQDWQDVRVLVDREAELDISLNVPYTFVYPSGDLISYEDFFKQEFYYISNEDPVFVELTFPSDSIAPTLSHTEVKFEYSNGDNDESFEIGFEPGKESTSDCFSFPWLLSKGCNILENMNDYTNFIEDWEENLISKLNVNPSPPHPAANYFKETTDDGLLSVSFSTEYCAAFGDSDSAEANINVVECLPHRNPQQPFAYPYDTFVFEDYNFDTEEGKYLPGAVPENDNPFLATHSCCAGVAGNPGSWGLKEAGEVCFRNPEPGCYGGIEQWTVLQPKYVLEQQVDTCDGLRGNVCGGTGTLNYDLWNGELRCGSNSLSSCSGIENVCQEELSWGYVDSDDDNTNDAWCHGNMGCSVICQAPDAVVFRQEGAVPSDINEYAKQLKATSDSSVFFHCGCTSQDIQNSNKCDSNFDGVFSGTCTESGCLEGN